MSYRGTTINEIELVNRYEKDLSNLNTKFPPIFNESIDYEKPDRDFIKDQISKLQPVLKNDEIMISFIENLIFDEFIKPKDLCLQLKPFFNNDSVKTVKFVEAIWKLLLHSSDSHNEISNSPKKIDYSTYKNRLENDETFDKVDRTNKANELFLIRGNDDRSNDKKKFRESYNYKNEKISRHNDSFGSRIGHYRDKTQRERYTDFGRRDRTPERRHRDRTLERRQRDRTPERRHRDRTPERRHRDRTPERRQRDRTPERRQRDRTPERRHRDRTPERRHRDRTPERRHRDRTPERRHRDRTPERRHRDRTPERRHRDRIPERRHRDRPPERGDLTGTSTKGLKEGNNNVDNEKNNQIE